MRRALDHGCLVTGIYNLADACCPQRHERKYGRVGTVLLILPAPTYHALTLSCGALGPNVPHHVTKPSTSVPRGYQSLVHGDVEWPPIRSRVSRRSRTKSVGFSRAGNASARSVRVSKVRGRKTYASDELAALTARHQSVRTELASTTLALEQAHANEHTTKLRTRALEQGLALAQNDAEWAHTELTREREAHATTRADLYSRAAQAEAAREMAEQERTSAAAQLAQAERLLTEAQTRHADAIHTNSELRMRLSSQERDAQLAKSAADQAIELSEARVQRAEQRAMELESSCDALMAECAARERDARAEADEAIADRERLEQDMVSLQEALDRMARALGVEDTSDDGLMMPSRAASLAAQVRHEGKRFSDVYIDAARTEEALRRESEERARLEGVLTEVMADLDAHAPQLKAQRAEAAQLRSDLDAALEELEEARSERDDAKAMHTSLCAEIERVRREHALDAQQLEDATAQVRTLLRETILLKDPSAAERLADDNDAPATGDIQDVISEELVTFRSLAELCAQNQRLLQAARELGQQLEAREPRDDELKEAADMLERVTRELETERASLHDARRERDMYRNVCLAKGLETSDAAPEAPKPVEPSFPPSVLADLQREAAARAAAEERIHMLQETTKFHETRLAEAATQASHLQAALDRRDAAVREAEQALAASRAAQHDALTRLAARDAELRLVQEQRDSLLTDNRRLGEARAAAEAAARDAHKVDAEHTQAHAAHVERLQHELAVLRATSTTQESHAAEARAEAAAASLRRETETHELRERLEALAQQHAAAREALATAQSDAQHQERRVSDLTVQLEHAHHVASLLEKQQAAAEERWRTSIAAAVGAPTGDAVLPPERHLEMELADVRRGRAAAEAETLAARSALAEAQTTQERLQADLEQAHKDLSEARQAAEHDRAETAQRIQALEEQCHAASARVTALEDELKAQTERHAAETREWEGAVTGLQDAEAREATEHASAWDEVRRFSAQANDAEARAKAADEGRAAAEAEIASLRADMARLRDEAEKLRTAKDMLAAEHNKYVLDAQARVLALEKAEASLQTQRDDLQQENDQLHTHLEAVSKQIATMHSDEVAKVENDEAPAAPATGELQVLRYLRREKDVRELERDMAVQERTRTEAALTRTQEALSACRAELAAAQEAAKAPVPNTQYTELLDKIHQLSALREHVATLTEAQQALEARNQNLETQLQHAQAELQPHRERLQHAQAELDASQSQLRVVQEDVARWKARASGLLQRSGVEQAMQQAEQERGQAQARIEQAQAETARLSTELQAANKRFEQLREQVRARITQERRAVAEAVERSKQLETQAQASEEAKQALENKLAELEKKEQEIKDEEPKDEGTKDEANGAPADAPSEHPAEAPQATDATSASDTPDASAPAAETPDIPLLEQQLRAKTEECEKHKHFARTFLKEKRAAEAQLKSLQEQPADQALQTRITELESLLAQANARISELETELAHIKDESVKAVKAKEDELQALRNAPEGTAAVQAKEAELQAHYQPLLQSRYEDGKREAALRNQIMIGQRDKKITNLTNEIAELKTKLGVDAPPAAAAKTSEQKETPASNPRPAVVRGGRGGAAPKPVPIKASEAGTSIRGAAASRGRGNGPAVLAVAGGAKRKRELHASTDDAKPAPKPATTKKSRAENKNANDT